MSDASKAQMERELAAKKAKLEDLRRAKAARQQAAAASEEAASHQATKLNAAAINMSPQQQTGTKQSAEDILNSVSSLISVAPSKATSTPSPAASPSSSTATKRSTATLGKSILQHTDILPGDAKILYEQATQTEESRRAKAQADADAAAAAGTGTTSTSTNTASVWDRIDEGEQDEIIHERDELRQREVELLSRIRELTQAVSQREEQEEINAEANLHRELPKAEQEKIEKSEEFHNFLERSSKIMERLLGYESNTRGVAGGASGIISALNSKFDYMEDYSAHDENENGHGGMNRNEGLLRSAVTFSMDQPGSSISTLNRPITSIAWSEKYPELLCASYANDRHDSSQNGSGSLLGGQSSSDSIADSWLEPDGTLLVWNLHMQKRPEYSFTCQSAIHTAQFHPAHPKLLVGACENGQLLIWDMRISNKYTPVNRSSLSHGHTHPVFSMSIQSLNSGLYQIVSCSSDGQICIWTENNLHRPLHDIQLVSMKSGGGAASSANTADGTSSSTGTSGVGALLGSKEDITTTIFDLPGRDTNSMILGSDEGMIYKARIHEKESERIYETIHAHDAPMTAIEFHPSVHQNSGTNTAGTSDLFLTASYDWTVKLWSHKLSRPLYTFESARDYVYSAAWCPSNPYIFAAGDGTGKLDVWNLAGESQENDDSEIPAWSVQVGAPVNNTAASSTSTGIPGTDSDATSALPTLRQNHAISKLKWNDTGSMIACGTSSGSLHLYDVSTELSAPTREATDRFYSKISSRITQPH